MCFCLQRYIVDNACLLSQKRNSVCGWVETVKEELTFLQILGLRYFRTSCNKALALTKVPTQARSSWVEQQKCRRVLSRNMEFSMRLGNRTLGLESVFTTAYRCVCQLWWMLWGKEGIEECRHVRTGLENSGVRDVRGSLWSPPKWRWLTEGGAAEPVAEGSFRRD